MLRALLYLRLTSLKNWFIARAKRLRQPKYLLSAAVGCAYFYFFFFRPIGQGVRHPANRMATAQAREALELANAALPADWLPAVTAFGALALLTFMTLMWVVPAQRAALGFSEAEIAFLFPAPITRRALVHFRLVSSQLRSLIGAAVMMLFSNRWSIIGGNALTHAIGWWFIFSALNLHFSGANFTLTRLADLGLGAWRRRALALAVIVAVIVASLVRLPANGRLPALSNELDLRPVTSWAIAVTNTAPLSWLLWPLKLLLGPFLALGGREFLVALGPALAVVTLHYLWVVRTAVAFEDASVDYAQKRGARLAAWRAGERRLGSAPTRARPAPFRLAGVGRPELAFLWKNLLSTWQYFNLRVLLVTAAVIVGTCIWLNTHPSWRGLLPGLGWPALMFGAYTLIVGPQFARQDIRSDLGHADILKTYPLAGWQIVLGEILAPVAILTGILWLTLLTMGLSLQPISPRVEWLTPQLRIVASAGLAALVPPLVTLQLLVPNAAALLFPGWFHFSRTRGGGPEVIGQRMIFFFAQLLTMGVALVPPIGVAALLIFILQTFVGATFAVSVAALLVFVVLLGEVWCGVWLLGQRFETLDLSAELRA
jgi:ABC-2 type transport system permease protein